LKIRDVLLAFDVVVFGWWVVISWLSAAFNAGHVVGCSSKYVTTISLRDDVSLKKGFLGIQFYGLSVVVAVFVSSRMDQGI